MVVRMVDIVDVVVVVMVVVVVYVYLVRSYLINQSDIISPPSMNTM